MRIFLLFVISFSFISPFFGQFVVEDPALIAVVQQMNVSQTINEAKNIAELATQTATLKNSLEILKEARESLQKVNKHLTEIIYFQDIIKLQLNLIKHQMEYISELKNDKKVTPKEIQTVNSNFISIVSRSEQLLKLSRDLLLDDKYKMSDAERLANIKKINEDMDGLLMESLSIQKHYDYMREERNIRNIINTW